LEIPVDRVGLKAKTGELVGPIGREEAISTECIVLLEKS
jgi:2-C-methyl-D-erythritol 2,4-cyclodiphosphate synthase